MKYFLAIPLVLLFSSCRKNYTCACGTTYKYPGGQDYFISKTAAYDKKMTKKQAESVCANEAKNINRTYENFLSNNGNWNTSGESVSTTCNLR